MVKNNLKIRILLQTKIQQCIAAGMHPQVAFGLLRSELSDHEQIDWDALEQLWQYGCSDLLKSDLHEHPLMVVDSAHSASQQPQRERLVEMLFETFAPPALYLARSPVLSAYVTPCAA